MIANLSKYDLVLTYSWGGNNHGITGHIFELIDYYWILKDHFKCCMLFAENFCRESIKGMIRSKYNFTDTEINMILDGCVFIYKPRIVISNNIIFTDGGINRDKNLVVRAKNKFVFSCSMIDTEGCIVLEDRRIYKRNNIDYKKKILFDKLIVPKKYDNMSLLYLTDNCRKVRTDTFISLSNRDEKFLCLVNNLQNVYLHPNFSYMIVPVDNLHERFDKYIYTPITRKWDCSPRFIAECRWLGKEVEYYNIDYWDEDLGLKYRVHDIENDFDSINLKVDDEIITILKRYIND